MRNCRDSAVTGGEWRPRRLLVPLSFQARHVSSSAPRRTRCCRIAPHRCCAGERSDTPKTPVVKKPFTPAQYSVADFYDNKGFFGASYSPDRKKVLVGSNASGIWSAYAIPIAGGEPEALTASTTNSIFPIGYFPGDARFLYSSDQGGNELAHIYVRITDGTIKDITPGKTLTASFLQWAGDDKSFFVTTNERDQRFFDLYEVNTDGLGKTLLYKNADGYSIGGVSRDKKYVALLKTNTTSDQDVFLYDVQKGTTTNVTTHTGTINNSPVDFSPDGTKLLFVSDSGREFSSLRSYDLATGAKAPVYEQNWDIVDAKYSKSGKYLVVAVNEDSKIASRVLDSKTLQRRASHRLVRGGAPARDQCAQREDQARGSRGAGGRAVQVVRQSGNSGCALQATPSVAGRESAGGRPRARRPRWTGTGRLLRTHPSDRQPRLRRIRHQQPRLERLRQEVLRDGRPQTWRSRPR